MATCPNHPSVYDLRTCSRCGRSYCQSCVVLLRGAYFCADCKAEQLRDVQSGTAPGTLDLASVSRRFGALWIDGVITGMASMAVFIPFVFVMAARPTPQTDPGTAELLFMLVLYPLMIGLPFVYEGLMLQKKGQTLGKMALGIKVVTADGRDISAGQAWGRTGMRTVLNFCMFVDYLPVFFDKDKKCIHDMAAKTRVVRLPH
jgi:uncharacterized RDD family membrane protein YckC